MKMYVANCTQQEQSFVYRVPEYPAPRQQLIRIGTQVQISGDLTQTEIDAIISQHRKYGLVEASDIDRTKPFVGLCYSIDKPVRETAIRGAIAHNRDVLAKRGEETRKEAAIAVANAIEESNPGVLGALELSVEEATPIGVKQGAPIEDVDRLGEQKVRVDRNAPEKETRNEEAQRNISGRTRAGQRTRK